MSGRASADLVKASTSNRDTSFRLSYVFLAKSFGFCYHSIANGKISYQKKENKICFGKNMVAPPRSRRGVFANQVAVYVNGIAKNTFLGYFLLQAAYSNGQKKNSEDLARNKGFLCILTS